MKNGNWFWVNKVLYDTHARVLGPVGQALYDCLARHADNDTACVYTTISSLARVLGISRQTARFYFRFLQTYGLITARFGQYPVFLNGTQTPKLWICFEVTLLDPDPGLVATRQVDEQGWPQPIVSRPVQRPGQKRPEPSLDETPVNGRHPAVMH